MRLVRIGVTIDAVIEREGRGGTRTSSAYDGAIFKRHLPTMEPEVFDKALGMMVMPTDFVVRTPHYDLVDTCRRGQGTSAAVRFSRQGRWRNELLRSASLTTRWTMCLHLHIDHTGWNTTLRDRWVPTFQTRIHLSQKGICGVGAEHAKAPIRPARFSGTIACRSSKQARRCWSMTIMRSDDTITLTPTPGHSPANCCVNIFRGSARS
jgi:hypothetical protein